MNMSRGNKGGQAVRDFGIKPTAQNKLVSVAEKLGIPGLVKQQGTTRQIYHFLKLKEGLNAETTYSFFKGVKNTQAPFTNITENKLQAGEAIAVERIVFAIMTVKQGTEGEVVNIQTLDAFGATGLYASQYNLKIGSQDYTKQNSMIVFKPEFNKDAMHSTYAVYTPGVFTVIPPDLEFYVNVFAPAITIPSSDTLDFYFGCFIDGDGSLMNMRETL